VWTKGEGAHLKHEYLQEREPKALVYDCVSVDLAARAAHEANHSYFFFFHCTHTHTQTHKHTPKHEHARARTRSMRYAPKKGLLRLKFVILWKVHFGMEACHLNKSLVEKKRKGKKESAKTVINQVIVVVRCWRSQLVQISSDLTSTPH